MGLVWKTFPDMNPEDQETIKFPKDLDDAKKLGQVLSRYKEQYFAQVCDRPDIMHGMNVNS